MFTDAEIQRFHSHTRKEDRGYTTPCLIWTGFTRGDGGYGFFRTTTPRRMVRAHVWAYALEHGDAYLENTIQGRTHEIDHLCRQKSCVAVDHLERVTRLVNLQRMHDALRTERCKRGHLWSEHGKVHARGFRVCGECARMADRRRRQREKEAQHR